LIRPLFIVWNRLKPFQQFALKFASVIAVICPHKTAIADFEQRWRQRGKTTDCSFK